MIKKIFIGSSVALVLFAVSVTSTFAHVVVSPEEVVVAARQDFSVGVPNEKDIPTTSVRLVIPEGLESVTPYVKQGWTIEMKESGEGEEAKVTEITWSGGEITKGLRDAFVFRAMTPAKEGTLTWKVYQTYSDGTVVSWDQTPSEGEEAESETSGPYSETKVVNDLTSTTSDTESKQDNTTMYVAYASLLVAAIALGLSLRRQASK